MFIALALTVLLGPQLETEPLPDIIRAQQCSSAALANLGRRVFLAWPERRGEMAGIVTTLLDEHLHELPGRRTFYPVPGVPSCVAAASNGSDVMVVWSSNGLYGMLLHPELTWIAAPTRLTNVAPARPGIGWQRGAGTYLIVSDQFYLEARPPNIASYTGGAMPSWNIEGGPAGRTMKYDAVAVSETLSAVSARGFAPEQTPCGVAGDCGDRVGPVASIGLAVPHPATPISVDSQGGAALPPTTVALLGEHALLAWLRRGFGPWYLIMTKWADRPMQMEATRDRVHWRSGLAAASEGDVVVLVWQEDLAPARIFGVVITRESMSEPFLIADGTTPSATALGDGRVLIAYDLGDRLAGRVVYIHAPVRRRAAR